MKLIHILNKIMKIIFVLFAIFMIFYNLQVGANDRLLSTASVFLVVLVPFLTNKLLRYKMSDALEFIYLIFILLAHILGSVVNLYSFVSWWDLFTHGLSGVLTAIIAILILKKYKLLKKRTILFTSIFMICFSLSIASCWEFFEFSMDKITGGDIQWVKITGVDDTMTDMLIAMAGTIIFTIYYTFSHKSKFITKMEETL